MTPDAIWYEEGQDWAMYRAIMARFRRLNIFLCQIGPCIGPLWPDSLDNVSLHRLFGQKTGHYVRTTTVCGIGDNSEASR